MHNFRNEIAENFMNSTEFNTQVTPSIHLSMGPFYWNQCLFHLEK